MKFLHAADVHLDSPLRGLERYPGAPATELRVATRDALVSLVELARREQVRFVVLAGDLFDRDGRDFHTALFAAEQLRALERAGIEVFLIFGNHDSRDEMRLRAPWPGNVRTFEGDRPTTFERTWDGVPVAVHGLSFRGRREQENPVPEYPAAVAGAFNVGLLHSSVEGSAQHDTYYPCRVSDLTAKGYDYWALGHVHTRQELSKRPWIAFPGNVQGRHAREPGAKGASVVEVGSGGAVRATFHALDVIRWAVIEVEAPAAAEPGDLVVAAERQAAEALKSADGRMLAVRLRFRGTSAAARPLSRPEVRLQFETDLRGRLADVGSGRIWVEKVQNDVTSPQERSPLELTGLPGEVVREAARWADEPGRLESLLREPELASLLDRLRQAGMTGESERFSPERLRGWLDQAAQLAVDRLVRED
jgi:DNA repair exonuclease SbcCD nuclease subunit